jgi:hypothetical protein
MKSAPPTTFVSRLRPLSILELERLSPRQAQRREAEEERELKAWCELQRRAQRPRPPREQARHVK